MQGIIHRAQAEVATRLGSISKLLRLLSFLSMASIMSSMANVLSTVKRVRIISALVEGMSIRATARMADVSKDTVSKLSLELGEACIRHMDSTLVNLLCKRLQVDEIW